MGPESSGRISAVAGVPGDSETYYAGAASGGVWKTTDGAKTFAPVFDAQSVQAIGALAVAPTDPKIIWAGAGEAWTIRDSDVMDDGVYKSIDAGATWTHTGLPETGRIGRIIVHPVQPGVHLSTAEYMRATRAGAGRLRSSHDGSDDMRLFDQRGQVLGTSQGPDTIVPKVGEEVFLTNSNQRRRVLDVTYFIPQNPGGIFTGMTIAVLLSDPVQAK